jgi:transglycosylase-like protein with SLT domain
MFDDEPRRDTSADAQDIADAPTRAERAPQARRTLASVPRAALEAAETTRQTSRQTNARQAQAGKEAGAVPTAPTRALQKATSDADRALAAVATAEDAKPIVISGARKPKPPARHIVPRRSGPRSFVAQFMVAMIATAMVASVLSLSTPLGQAASLSAGGSFYALSNSAPWLPTPTHTPKPQTYRPPVGANPGQQAIINEIVAVFGSYSQGALNIAKCESGYDPNAWNSYPIMGSHASGVFQILYPSTWNSTSYSGYSPFNADANIKAAYQIFHRDGNSWREWQCKSY